MKVYPLNNTQTDHPVDSSGKRIATREEQTAQASTRIEHKVRIWKLKRLYLHLSQVILEDSVLFGYAGT